MENFGDSHHPGTSNNHVSIDENGETTHGFLGKDLVHHPTETTNKTWFRDMDPIIWQSIAVFALLVARNNNSHRNAQPHYLFFAFSSSCWAEVPSARIHSLKAALLSWVRFGWGWLFQSYDGKLGKGSCWKLKSILFRHSFQRETLLNQFVVCSITKFP